MTRSKQTDNELLAAAQDGDEQAFEEFVRRYERLLLKIAYGILLDWHEAQDAAQAALIGLCRSMRTLDATQPEAVRRFLSRCAHNAAIDLTRRRAKRAAPHDLGDDHVAPGGGPMARMLGQEDHAALVECIRQLPHLHRLALVLRFVGVMSMEDVKQCLDDLPEVDPAKVYEEGSRVLKEIAKVTAPHGVGSVAGVHNLIAQGRKMLERCFEERTPR